MTSAQVVETSVTNNSSSQNYTHPGDHSIRTTDTPGFKPLTMIVRTAGDGKECRGKRLTDLELVSSAAVGWDVTQRSPQGNAFLWGERCVISPKTAAEETNLEWARSNWHTLLRSFCAQKNCLRTKKTHSCKLIPN